MQRLVGVADKMDEPHEIVGLDVVARVRRERCRERFDLRESVYWIGRTHRCSVGRKRKIEIVPIFVAQLIGIADVSRGVVAGRGIARVGVAILSLDVVGPGRGMDEGEAVAIGVRNPADPF
jgi:hypothetical protein